MNFILDNYNKLMQLDDGKAKFSKLVCQITPYFASIDPRVEDLRPGYGRWSMIKRKEVENHIGTVHAIAMCNLCEVTAGLTTEVSIPGHLRWIPSGMQVQYLKKAHTDLVAECTLGDVDWDNIDNLDVTVSVCDREGKEVVRAVITMKIGAKPES